MANHGDNKWENDAVRVPEEDIEVTFPDSSSESSKKVSNQLESSSSDQDMEVIRVSEQDIEVTHPDDSDPSISEPKDLSREVQEVKIAMQWAGFPLKEAQSLGIYTTSDCEESNLECEIFPVFSLSNWTTTNPELGWRAEYDEILNGILRLATRILLSPASIAFQWSIMYQKREFLPKVSKEMGLPLYGIEQPPKYNQKIHKEWLRGMGQIAPMVMFGLYDEADFNSYFKMDRCSVAGYTERFHKINNAHSLEAPGYRRWDLRNRPDYWLRHTVHFDNQGIGDQEFSGGTPARVLLNMQFLSELAAKRQEEVWSTGTANHIFRLQFLAAYTLCHELIHAINMVLTKDHGEPYYENHRLNELGEVWEQHVFGGKIESLVVPQTRPCPLIFCKVFHCMKENMPIAKCFRREPPQGSSTWYFVPAQWIVDLQREENWARLQGHIVDESLLRIPKTVGYRRYHPRQDLVDTNWQGSQSSENIPSEESVEGQWVGTKRVFRASATEVRWPGELKVAT